MNAAEHVARSIRSAIPAQRETSVARWADRHVKTFGARGNAFDSSKTPWVIEPMDRIGDGGITRKITVVGPVQSAKSVITEVGACYVLGTESSGDVQWNFQDDEFADDRWDKRLRRILENCEPVARRWPVGDRSQDRKGLVIFPHCSLTVQGVFTRKNVASDSIRFQFNDEIHLWEPGRLAQAHNRTTAYWNSLVVNVSNAGDIGDQLHIEYADGTMQRWQVKCPGCGEFHSLRLRWKDDEAALGGLRYDAEGCRRDNGDYDYLKLESTVRLQLPCGFEVREDMRRKLSETGRYSEPTNEGARVSHRSYSLDAAAIDYLPFIKLIQEKHKAIKAMRYGDPAPYRAYVTERECEFWDAEDRPMLKSIVLTRNAKKNREGLPGRFARYFSLDRQQGKLSAGELPHWWLVIRDVMPNGDSMLVWEGKCLTDENAVGTIKEHGCLMRHGVADSGDDTTHVYQFCLRHGINAIKGSDTAHAHKDGTKKVYSVEKPLHKMINAPATFPYQRKLCIEPGGERVMRLVPHIDEPLFWFYHNAGLRDRFAWVKSDKSVLKFEIPEDVSNDYKKHAEAWSLEERRNGKSKELVSQYVQHSRRDDLDKCEQYIVMMMEMAGLIGERAAER